MHQVDQYNDAQTPEVRALFNHMGDIVRELIPDIAQGLSYDMPCFLYNEKALIATIVNKKFLSLYPYSGKTIMTLEKELEGFETTPGSIHFSVAKPIPDELLIQIVKVRMQEIDHKK